MADMFPFRVLVSGAGSIGQRHLKNLHSIGVAALASCDPNAEPEVPSEHFSDYSEALSVFQPDVVFICSPTKFHIAQALQAAEAGCHLFIEKPLSHTLEGIDELQRIVEDKHLIIMVACNMRFHPGPKKIKELIDAGAVGDVIAARIHSGSYLPRWRRKVPYKESYSADPKQGGVLLDCIHEIDLALWYLGNAVLQSATVLPATSIGLDVDGLAELTLAHRSGAISTVHLSFIQHTWRRGCHVIGSEGTIEWDIRTPLGVPLSEGDDPRVRLYGSDGKLREAFAAEGDRDQPYQEEVQHFLDAIERGQQTSAPLRDGKAAIEIALAAKGSVSSGAL